MNELLIILDVVIAIAIVALVLLQQSKAADMGAMLGGGGSTSLFGSKGSANFMTRTTAVLAIIFFVTNIGLMVLNARQIGPGSVTDKLITREVEKPKVAGKGAKKKASTSKKKKASTKGVPVIPE